ncbi:CPBP family intramembrane glutamic endopeptidase [Streptoalloteichus hindustanus]|uniref:CAAX prenyl protease 2/Lysostaphin resistance protein A-like domain-containing protein n=1 Tax=Streptoalloteichus hindustanus TaxID=2017 RepID=A0A1M5EX85_STRHI|nr:CPBP family intramembrane glutamic endopeptidase [Streptoalloteichus hindustanus]SHF83807.1 hypothetical protein SAMN05444320_105178 [Streptoalloteichus hindustanus]
MDVTSAHGTSRSTTSPRAFFGLVLLLGVPFWLLGALSGARLPATLPVSALGFVCPLVAAVILVRREEGGAGVRQLLRRIFDQSRITRRRWYLPTFLLMPAIVLAAYLLMRLSGQPLPEPRISLLTGLVYCVVYFVAAAAEEVGWTGYVTDPLQRRWGALGAGVLIGSVWAVWHVVPWLQVRDVRWTVWQCVLTVAARVLIVWLYNNTGRSVFAAIVCHATINVSYSLFPNEGSHYDPAFVGAVMVVAVVVVTCSGTRQP